MPYLDGPIFLNSTSHWDSHQCCSNRELHLQVSEERVLPISPSQSSQLICANISSTICTERVIDEYICYSVLSGLRALRKDWENRLKIEEDQQQWIVKSLEPCFAGSTYHSYCFFCANAIKYYDIKFVLLAVLLSSIFEKSYKPSQCQCCKNRIHARKNTKFFSHNLLH